MPWEQTSAMDQRVQFIADWLSEDYTKMDLCRAYGISRPTADKWINATNKVAWSNLRNARARRTAIPIRLLRKFVRC